MVNSRRVGAGSKARRGFTIVEVLVSILMITFGILGFIGSTAGVTKMISRGNRAAVASAYNQGRLERVQATPCGRLATGTQTNGRFTTAWTVEDYMGGRTKRVRIVTQFPGVRGATRADTLETTVLCMQ
jgi:Tfp pilus assembly protein PilE